MNTSSDIKDDADKPMLLSVILPIRNEESILLNATNEFAQHFDKIVGTGCWQYVLVLNGCTDKSSEIARQITQERPRTIVLEYEEANIGESQRNGILAAEGTWTFLMNVDHVWDSPYFDWTWRHREEYQLVLGSKRADITINKQTRYRKLLSNGLNALLYFFFHFEGMETRGMKLLNTKAMMPIISSAVMRRGQFDTEITIKAIRDSLWVAELPMPYAEKRPPRNFMIKKIGQNILDLFLLGRELNKYPYKGNVRYRRFCREDLLDSTHKAE